MASSLKASIFILPHLSFDSKNYKFPSSTFFVKGIIIVEVRYDET